PLDRPSPPDLRRFRSCGATILPVVRLIVLREVRLVDHRTGLDQGDLQPGLGQLLRRPTPGSPRADDDGVKALRVTVNDLHGGHCISRTCAICEAERG